MITIRSAIPDDLQKLKALLFYLNQQTPWQDDQEAIQALEQIATSSSRIILVAEEEECLIGTLGLTFAPCLTRGLKPFAFIDSVVVDPGHRGRGVGMALLEEASAQAEAKGCYKLEVVSADYREEAHRLYQKVGFEANVRGFRLYL